MYPHAHLAIGYLVFSAYAYGVLRRPPSRREAIVVLIGSQFSDLIDKPLLLLGGLFASGRTIAHSMLVVLPVIFCLLLLCRQDSEAWNAAVAFGLSWAVQPFADASLFVLQGTVARDLLEISFLVWPVTLPADSIIEVVSNTPSVEMIIREKPLWTARTLPKGANLRFWVRVFELSIAVVAGLKWYDDGAPGVEKIRSAM